MPKIKPPLEDCLGDPIKFYDGKCILRFDQKGHTYYLCFPDGTFKRQDGVTGVCGILDKSMFLMPWACKLMEQRMLQTMPHAADFIGEYTESISWEEFADLLSKAKRAHKDAFTDARDVGAEAHKWIEDSIRWAIGFNHGVVVHLTDEMPSDERAISCGHAALDWMQNHNVRWKQTEKIVYSREYEYAGTMDGLALVDSCDDPVCCQLSFKDELSVIDWKSSNALRTEYLYQTAAYQQAAMEEHGWDIQSRWILRLDKENGNFEPWYTRNFAQDFEAFKLCLHLKRRHATIEKGILDGKKERSLRKKEKR